VVAGSAARPGGALTEGAPGSGPSTAEQGGAGGAPILELSNVEVTYSGVILVLKGINITVPQRGCVALLGPNGAGKSTTLKAVSGVLKTEEGLVSAGQVRFAGERIDTLAAERTVRKGILHVMEGRKVLEHMTVEQNLVAGGHLQRSRDAKESLELTYEYFPRLAELRGRTSGYLSGGEQQMLVIGRALMARPKLMMIDEPSLGLAPLMVEEIFSILHRLRREDLALVIVEQNTSAALELADYGYVLDNGRIVLDGTAENLRSNEDIREFYLGLGASGERKSFRDIKHYRRRKRWLG
jgi:branched-chain amino acid transport system ATP-binding protein